MIFHLGTDLPPKKSRELKHEEIALSDEEVRILKRQIRMNRRVIQGIVERVELLVNKEGHPQDSEVVTAARKQLQLLMEENDTFRDVLWRHMKTLAPR